MGWRVGGCAPPSVLTPQKLKENNLRAKEEESREGVLPCEALILDPRVGSSREHKAKPTVSGDQRDDPEAPLSLSRSCGIQPSCSPRPQPVSGGSVSSHRRSRFKHSSAAASYPPIRRGRNYSCVRVPDRQHVDRPGGGRRGLAPAASRPRCALLSRIPDPRTRGSHTEVALVLGKRHGAAGLPRACYRRAPAGDTAVSARLLAPGVRVTVQSQRHRYVRAVQLVPAPGQAAQPADAGPRHAARPRACAARARALPRCPRSAPSLARTAFGQSETACGPFMVEPRVSRI